MWSEGASSFFSLIWFDYQSDAIALADFVCYTLCVPCVPKVENSILRSRLEKEIHLTNIWHWNVPLNSVFDFEFFSSILSHFDCYFVSLIIWANEYWNLICKIAACQLFESGGKISIERTFNGFGSRIIITKSIVLYCFHSDNEFSTSFLRKWKLMDLVSNTNTPFYPLYSQT